jgi:hypothetical protein
VSAGCPSGWPALFRVHGWFCPHPYPTPSFVSDETHPVEAGNAFCNASRIPPSPNVFA